MDAIAVPTTFLLRIEYTPTAEDFIEASLYPFRAQRLRGVIFILCFSVLMGVMAFMRWVDPTWAGPLAGGAFLLAISNPHTVRRTLRDYFRKHPQLGEVSIATYVEEGIFVQTASADALTRWHAFTHFTESKQLFFLHRGPGNPVYLAKRVFSTPVELDNYRQLLTQYIGRTVHESRHGFPVTLTASKSDSPAT